MCVILKVLQGFKDAYSEARGINISSGAVTLSSTLGFFMEGCLGLVQRRPASLDLKRWNKR